jgi:hypothetical protein
MVSTLVWLAQNCKRNARSGYREYKFIKGTAKCKQNNKNQIFERGLWALLGEVRSGPEPFETNRLFPHTKTRSR